MRILERTHQMQFLRLFFSPLLLNVGIYIFLFFNHLLNG